MIHAVSIRVSSCVSSRSASNLDRFKSEGTHFSNLCPNTRTVNSLRILKAELKAFPQSDKKDKWDRQVWTTLRMSNGI